MVMKPKWRKPYNQSNIYSNIYLYIYTIHAASKNHSRFYKDYALQGRQQTSSILVQPRHKLSIVRGKEPKYRMAAFSSRVLKSGMVSSVLKSWGSAQATFWIDVLEELVSILRHFVDDSQHMSATHTLYTILLWGC